MSLLIRSKGNSPLEENISFEPFLANDMNDGSSRRIFQLSGSKRDADFSNEKNYPCSGGRVMNDVRLRLDFDKTPTKKIRDPYN